MLVIIALDLNSLERRILNYFKKTAREKIDYLVKRIQVVCEQLQQLEPNSLWLVAAREECITEIHSKFLSPELKKYFKSEMLKLTQKYKQLSIILPIASYKLFENEKCNEKLLQKPLQIKMRK